MAKELTAIQMKLAERVKQAKQSTADMGGGSDSISLKGGLFTIDGNELEGSTLDVVVIDSAVQVTVYLDPYDEDHVVNPDASAVGRKFSELVWADSSTIEGIAGESVEDSEYNEWGSADTGRGKLAKARFRLMVIAEDDLEDIPHAEVRMITVPVTSGKNWAKYVKTLAAADIPPLGMLTRLTIKRDAKTSFKLLFEGLGEVDEGCLEELFQLAESVEDDLLKPYEAKGDEEEEAPPVKQKAKPKAKSKATRNR